MPYYEVETNAAIRLLIYASCINDLIFKIRLNNINTEDVESIKKVHYYKVIV